MAIIVVTSRIDAYTLVRMERLHLRTLVDSGVKTIDTFAEALAAARQDRPLLSRRYLAARHAYNTGAGSLVRRLTDHECALLSLIGLGLDNAEIGLRLGLSECTVKWHRSRILSRLGLTTTAKLVAFATVHGFVRAQGAA